MTGVSKSNFLSENVAKLCQALPGPDVVDDDGHGADRHQDDAQDADHQETRVVAAAPPGLTQILLPSSLGHLRRAEATPGELLVAVVGAAAAEEKLGLLGVLQPGRVVHTGGPAGRGGGQAGDGVEAALSEHSPLPPHILLPHGET